MVKIFRHISLGREGASRRTSQDLYSSSFASQYDVLCVCVDFMVDHHIVIAAEFELIVWLKL